MRKIDFSPITSAAIALTAIASAISPAASAAAPQCWTPTEVTAAKVNELSILLNVQSLRCRKEDPEIQDKYASFARASAPTMKGIAKTLNARFGGNASLMDRYTISLANKYGAGVPGQSCTMVAGLMQSATLAGKSLAGLSVVADSAMITPTLAGGTCQNNTAALIKPKPKAK